MTFSGVPPSPAPTTGMMCHPAGAEHPSRRWTFPRWRIVAVAAVILVGGLLVTPAFGIGGSLLDLLKGGPRGSRRTARPRSGTFLLVARRKDRVRGPHRVTEEWSVSGYVMNADGSGKRALLEPGDSVSWVRSWSPDGRMIVFSRRGQVYVMNADGSGERRLTSRPGAAFADAWSPDGRKIAFTVRSSGNNGIYVMNADGSGQRKLTRASTFDPHGRPTGGRSPSRAYGPATARS